jgi:hypothetical protein
MKIMICGSMRFAKKMVEAKKSLEKLGHSVYLPIDIKIHLSDSSFSDNLDADYKHCIENDTIKKCFDLIEQSDAILHLNLKKNGKESYIGTSGLMEIGLAHYLGKKIFLFNKLPNYKDARWAHEVAIMRPVILDGNFDKIK